MMTALDAEQRLHKNARPQRLRTTAFRLESSQRLKHFHLIDQNEEVGEAEISLTDLGLHLGTGSEQASRDVLELLIGPGGNVFMELGRRQSGGFKLSTQLVQER